MELADLPASHFLPLLSFFGLLFLPLFPFNGPFPPEFLLCLQLALFPGVVVLIKALASPHLMGACNSGIRQAPMMSATFEGNEEDKASDHDDRADVETVRYLIFHNNGGARQGSAQR